MPSSRAPAEVSAALLLLNWEDSVRNVVLAARSRTELEQTAAAIGANASVMPADVRKKDDVQRLFEHTNKTFGPVDILVNAAGLGIFGPVRDFKDEDFENLIETNLRGIFFTSPLRISLYDRTQEGSHHQYRLYRGQSRFGQSCGILRDEIRGRRVYRISGGRSAAVRHPGLRHLSGIDGYSIFQRARRREKLESGCCGRKTSHMP